MILFCKAAVEVWFDISGKSAIVNLYSHKNCYNGEFSYGNTVSMKLNICLLTCVNLGIFMHRHNFMCMIMINICLKLNFL